jgi:hypothetical protein
VTLGVDAERARHLAELQRKRWPARDPHFAPWSAASTGEPVVVSSITGEPEYWTVPIEARGRAVGFVRVTGDGTVAAAGALYRDPRHLEACPAVVTGITAEAAARAAAAAVGVTADRVASAVYVHDGPPGREAWSVLVATDDGPRHLLVTAAGVQERSAGQG